MWYSVKRLIKNKEGQDPAFFVSYNLVNGKVKAYNKVPQPMAGIEDSLHGSPPAIATGGACKLLVVTSSKKIGQR